MASRSSYALKFVDVGGGVTDADYIGNICDILYIYSSKFYKIDVGKKIAQIILEKIELFEFVEVSELPERERGTNGLGGTTKYIFVNQRKCISTTKLTIYLLNSTKPF